MSGSCRRISRALPGTVHRTRDAFGPVCAIHSLISSFVLRSPDDAAPPFHPIINDWFTGRFFASATRCSCGLAAIQSGRDLLISAPTGSGKTLRLFSCIDTLFQQAVLRDLRDETPDPHVPPLKAPGTTSRRDPNSRRRNRSGCFGRVSLPDLRVVVRTGDTPMTERQQMPRRPPHILITTPESSLFFSPRKKPGDVAHGAHSDCGRNSCGCTQQARAHLALSLERAAVLAGGAVQRSASRRRSDLSNSSLTFWAAVASHVFVNRDIAASRSRTG